MEVLPVGKRRGLQLCNSLYVTFHFCKSKGLLFDFSWVVWALSLGGRLGYYNFVLFAREEDVL